MNSAQVTPPAAGMIAALPPNPEQGGGGGGGGDPPNPEQIAAMLKASLGKGKVTAPGAGAAEAVEEVMTPGAAAEAANAGWVGAPFPAGGGGACAAGRQPGVMPANYTVTRRTFV